ncbi:MAG: DUF4339 domain-containing protein [Planctomycetes bacterium]|nr:DUF4339 domain-containing protein [Planctomycetota bacterium]MBT4559476.1 DUF4339 domain-containing protein [Planctomycetota bacterium]MBT5119471.1 DUF4339 domain-containing protein [Planctomycetota bacterium]MBT7011424.1 DUF4339 domain-containing protein [Planctomycetota bacterium]MBT7318997.1 DUF4339 domain-containing protein [Planctomycetota bacterium]
MSEWYYGFEGEQKGPVPESVLQHMLERGGLPEKTLVWSEGMAEWVPAKKVAQLQPQPEQPRAFVEPPPRKPKPGVRDFLGGDSSDDASYAPKGGAATLEAEGTPKATAPSAHPQAANSQVRPWARFWGRIVDISLFQSVLIMLFDLNPLHFSHSLGALFLWVFIDAFCISRWGATPGRWLMRTRIYTSNGMLLPYKIAVQRNIAVTLRGMALGLPLVSLLFMMLAYKELTERGMTSWDREMGSSVSHHQIGGGRVLLTVVLMLVVSQLVMTLSPEIAAEMSNGLFGR